jgi:hypothetical protein
VERVTDPDDLEEWIDLLQELDAEFLRITVEKRKAEEKARERKKR